MNYLITGANGFLGKHLSRHLKLEDPTCKIVGLGHGNWANAQEQMFWGVDEWHQGDITLDALDSAYGSGALPNVVFHLAGGSSVGLSFNSPYDDFLNSASSTARICEWLFRSAPSTYLVYASSAAVYGDRYSTPIKECMATNPYSPYGTNKLISEQLIQSYTTYFNINASVVRLFSIYGEQLRKQIFWDICKKISSNPGTLFLGGSGDEIRDFVHSSDVCNALSLVATKKLPNYNLFNCGSGEGVSILNIARMITSSFGLSQIPIEFSGVSRTGDPKTLIADAKQLYTLGFSPTKSLASGVEDYCNWFQREVQP